MPSCVVKWCKNNTTRHKKNKGITFHRFPSANLPWKKDWIDVIRECRREADWTPTKSSVVCSIHFDANDLYVTETGRLKVVNFGMPKKIPYGTEDVTTNNLEQSYKESCPSSASTSFPQTPPEIVNLVSNLEQTFPLTQSCLSSASTSFPQRKRAKYSNLEPVYDFVPFAVETAGPWCSEARCLVGEIGRRLRERGKDPRSGFFLMQQISLAVQRGNAASILDPSKNELSNNERGFENQKTLKKFEICYGQPFIENFRATKQIQRNNHKSRSISVIHLKSSFIRCLRSAVSKSPDNKYSTPISRSLCCVLDPPSKSHHISPSVADSKSVSSRVGSKSPSSYSFYSNSSSRSSSYDSSSPCSKSPRSRSPASFKPTCSRSRIHHSRSPAFKRTRRSPSRSPTSKRSCLKSPVTQYRFSKSVVSKSSCLRTAFTAQYSKSPPLPPPIPSCLRQSPSKYRRIRSPVPRKSCIKPSTSKSPDKKSLPLRPSCLKNSSYWAQSNQSACKPPCLKAQVVTFSKPKSSNSKPQITRLSRLESCQSKSQKTRSNFKAPISKNTLSSNSNKSQHRSPYPKSITSKSGCARQSRSPALKSPPTKSLTSSKTPSYKTANSRSNQSSSPQSYSPAPKSPCGRSSPPKATVPTLDVSRFPKSPFSKDSRVVESNRAYSKPETKRPKLTVSKLFARSRLSQGLRFNDGRQKPRSSHVISDYRRIDQVLKYRLSRHLNKSLNREYLEKSLAAKMDVRYINELKNYFDRIRGTLTCNSPECPALQERFRKHRMHYHGGQDSPNMQPEHSALKICPELMKRRNSHNSIYHGGKVTGSEAQTKITLANLGGFTISLEKRPTSTRNIMQDGPHEPVGMGMETKAPNESSLHVLNNYKMDVNDELNQWIRKVPTREDTPEDEQRKIAIVRNFMNNVNAMDLSNIDLETEFWLKKEIDYLLDNVNMWYPGSNSDRKAFKDGLRENLIERLVHENERFREILRNVEDNNRNDNMVSKSTQNYPGNEPHNYANNGTQPYGMYGTQNYGNNRTQDYVYSGSQPFRTFRPQNYGKEGMQNHANDGVPSQAQGNSNQPYRNMYTGNSTNSGTERPYYNERQFPVNYGAQNHVGEGTQEYSNNGFPLSSQSNSTQPNGYLNTKSNNIINAAQKPAAAAAAAAFKDPSKIVIDKHGNLVSYEQLKTPSHGFNKTLPNLAPSSMQNQSNQSYNIIEPTHSRILNTNPNNDIIRNDNPSILSNLSRIASKNQNQEGPKPSIRISDNPSYKNGGYTPDNVGQPRRPSLKSASNSNTNYENEVAADKDPTSRLGLEPTTQRKLTTWQKPHNIEPKNLHTLNYLNSPYNSYTMSKLRIATENRPPLRNTTYDSSCSQIGEDSDHMETCKSYTKNINPISYSDSNVKCTVKSKEICICPDPNEIVEKQKACCGLTQIDIETEIADWLKKCTFIRYDGLMNKHEIIDAIVLQISPYLSQPSYSLNKAVLKAKIMNVLRGLGVCANTDSGMRNILFRRANELANRLIGIASRLECSGASSWKCSLIKNRPFRYIEQVHVGPNEVNREDLKHDLLQEYEYCVHGTKLENNREILELISELVIDKFELIRQNADEIVRNDIKQILRNVSILNEEEIINIVDSILKYTREICLMITSTNNRTDTTIIARPVRSVFTSEHNVTPNFEAAAGSSTPKRKKEVPKLSPEENTYTDQISSAVRDWLKTVPDYFENLNDNNMKEVMILDLAGSIADHAKLGQIISKQMDSHQFMSYFIYKWLLKFEIVDELRRAKPYVEALVKKLQEIDVPKLTRPQHGTRQAMDNILFQEAEAAEGWSDSFVPKGQHILEDEISIWMNEYPSDIYVNKDKSTLNKLVHEFAENLQKHEKDDKEEISKEIKTWLENVVNSEDKEMIEMMSKNLQDRISKLPRDETIAAVFKQRREDLRKVDEPDLPMEIPQIVNQEENDKTMKEFIIKYVEFYYDEDDPLAKRAYAKLLRHELQRLDPNVLKQIYEGLPLEKFSPQRLFMELGYIKDISDWLKTLPIVDENYHKTGNIKRVEFCINLAKEITAIDAERHQGAMDYDAYTATFICQYIGQLTLKLDKDANITEYVYSLIRKIYDRRVRGEVPPISSNIWSNIADFLDDFIKLNGQDIANDEVKLEAWAARLIQEIKNMIIDNPVSPITEADVKNRLAQVTKPGDETIKRFNHELVYAKEISDWLKNFPLVNFENEEAIRDLAEKMAEYENNVNDNELVSYIKKWISKLPLDKNKQIDVPFAIQQLLNRKKKVSEVKTNKNLPLDQSVKQMSAGTSINTINSGAKTECRGCCPVDDPGSVIIQVIKEWCDNLRFSGAEEDIKSRKNDMKGKLYQKLIEINDNPRTARNDLLYMESLSDKINELLGNIPNNLKLDGENNKLKKEFLDRVIQARMFYKDVTLGDEYMKDLEDAIEAVLPNPSPQGEVNPGFEAYKENLAEMFILENFDHGNDADKLKYEQMMKKEVNKFSPSAQKRTVLPIQEEKLNNDIISTLFDVNMPDEKAMVDNVEEIKTKCEIQNWFEKLPLKAISGEAELLERDLKVSLLARKLHILEFEKDPDEKIHKEITKWLTKVPLSAGKDVNIDAFANDLQEILKSTSKSRKCVKASDVDIGRSGILSGSSTDHDAQNSIWVNPNTIVESENKIQQPPRLKSGDILIDIVEKWSDNIPLPPLPNNQLQIIKGDLRTKLYKKISELNSTNVFDNDQMYNSLMGEEIAQALAALPQSDALVQSQYALQNQLISAIESIKPLIREERELHEYKKFVENTVSSILGSPKNPTTEEKLLLSKIQEEVVSDFIEYKYNKDDEEGKQFYKNKILDALTEYNSIGEKEENRNEIVSDTLVEANKLICELDKIPPPNESALKEEVEELRMKREINNFLENVAPADQVPNNVDRNSLRNSLAKQLHELEKSGHSEENDQKMEDAVNRTLKKLDAEAKKDKVKPLLEKLKKTEGIRRPGYKDSPSRALRQLVQEQMLWLEKNAPRRESVSLDPQGVQVQIDASVYQPDFIPHDWKPPTPPPPISTNPDLLEVLPRQSLPPSPGPIGSGLMPSNVHNTITQPTQIPARMTEMNQTSGPPFGSQRMSPQPPQKFQQLPGQGTPQHDAKFVPGQYPPPSQSPTSKGQSQMSPQLVPGQTQTDHRLVRGQTQIDPRWAPGQSQFDPRLIPGPSQYVPPQRSNARIESEVELIGDECLCDYCKDRCPYFDRENCEDFYPMMCRRPMMPVRPMMPTMPNMPMPYPSLIMPPPAFMYC